MKPPPILCIGEFCVLDRAIVGPVSIGDLTSYLNLDGTENARLWADQLVAKGFLKHEGRTYRLTPAGRKIHRAWLPRARAHLDHLTQLGKPHARNGRLQPA